MEKYGAENQTLLDGLRDEEAQLMQQMQSLMSDKTKTAADKSQLENRLQQVRHKITELDNATNK